jgi:hypothetical protein
VELHQAGVRITMVRPLTVLWFAHSLADIGECRLVVKRLGSNMLDFVEAFSPPFKAALPSAPQPSSFR